MFYETHLPEETTCHTGGAIGADTIWELYSMIYGANVKAYSYKTKSHKSKNKIEISEDDYYEGVEKIKKVNKILSRKNVDKYMNLLARNWAQVKYSKEIFAIGNIVKEGDISKSGYSVKCKSSSVDGGTGYAVHMGILAEKTIYVFDQKKLSWYKWSYILEDFLKIKDTPIIQSTDFAGIGTRELSPEGELAIEEVFKKTFNK